MEITVTRYPEKKKPADKADEKARTRTCPCCSGSGVVAPSEAKEAARRWLALSKAAK